MTDLTRVISAMRAISPVVVTAALDAVQSRDPEAGILIAKLEETPVSAGKQLYHFYVARVLGIDEGQHYVTPHLHLIGDEAYRFIEGRGEMYIGMLINGDDVTWLKPIKTSEDAEYVIREGEAHCLRNLGNEPLDFIFACPESHLKDASPQGGDRYIVKDYKNGVPPHFPES